MIPIAMELERAALSNRSRIGEDAAGVSAAQTIPGAGANVERAMGQIAQHEEFEEALLAAAKSHFTEITIVTKQ